MRPSSRHLLALSALVVTGVLALLAPSASAAPTRGIWLSQSEIDALPMTGSAWQAVKAAADGWLGYPRVADQDSDHDVRTLAVALVYARTGITSYRQKAAAAILGAVGTEAGGRTLALARNLVGYAVAADLIDLRSYDATGDARFRAWLSGVRYATLDGLSLVQTQERRGNNWGTNAGAARVAADAYLGDTGDLGRAAQVFRGWLGDRGAYSGFSYGDLSWQADKASPVGINKRGATISGQNVDGVLPDDQRRAGPFAWPPPRENYVWGALGPAFVEAELLRRAGYGDVYQWSDAALKRALDWLHGAAAFPATGDDRWVPWVANAAYGTSYPASGGSIGKAMAWTDWTHARAGSPSTTPPPLAGPVSQTVLPSTGPAPAPPPPPPPPAPTPAPTPTPATTPAPAPAPTPAAPPGTASLSIPASADAQVHSGSPTKNYGSFPTLRVRAGWANGSSYSSYITFRVWGLSGPVKSAKLRLYAVDRSDDGGSVYATSSAWSEWGITWSTAPAVGALLAQAGAPAAATWLEVDVSSLVKGNGTYSFAITSASTNSVYYASREGGNAPTLLLTF